MSLAQQIDDDLKSALKAGEADKLSTLRLLKNSLDAVVKDKKAQLNDDEVIKVVQKEVKQRRDSIASYQQGNRQDLAAKEEAELNILEQYLPKQLDEAELQKIVTQVIKDTGAASMADMGKVMGALNQKLAGQADGSQLAQLVRARLDSTKP